MKLKLISFLILLSVNFIGNNKTEQSDEGIKFIHTKKTLDEQLLQFKGKIVYIDVWATFCSPCIKILKYKKEYDNYFADNDIAVLCLCIDNAKRKETWKKIIQKNLVSGYHVFIENDSIKNYMTGLKASKKCRKTLGQGFPRFLIVNRNGVVVEDRALPPCDKLITKMNKYL